ncbi:GntR family transcriptional regulator [Paramicrobacterium agarici]|uniref:GntR family transcriptional regulator n=1 Tax=Paramicrobacterium agarici TaxID=630514 RepID=UPI001FECA8A9|nr:FCD domain-containing protein [Microbacterium agarici]
MRQIYEMRLQLEPWAVASAVSRPDVTFTDAQAALDEAKTFREAGEQGSQALANRRFHRAMYRACDNDFVVSALDGLQDLTALATTGILWENFPTWEKESDEHQAILEAATAGEAAKVEALSREHIERSVELVRHLQRE